MLKILNSCHKPDLRSKRGFSNILLRAFPIVYECTNYKREIQPLHVLWKQKTYNQNPTRPSSALSILKSIFNLVMHSKRTVCILSFKHLIKVLVYVISSTPLLQSRTWRHEGKLAFSLQLLINSRKCSFY